jgi:hypothetical protein
LGTPGRKIPESKCDGIEVALLIFDKNQKRSRLVAADCGKNRQAAGFNGAPNGVNPAFKIKAVQKLPGSPGTDDLTKAFSCARQGERG